MVICPFYILENAIPSAKRVLGHEQGDVLRTHLVCVACVLQIRGAVAPCRRLATTLVRQRTPHAKRCMSLYRGTEGSKRKSLRMIFVATITGYMIGGFVVGRYVWSTFDKEWTVSDEEITELLLEEVCGCCCGWWQGRVFVGHWTSIAKPQAQPLAFLVSLSFSDPRSPLSRRSHCVKKGHLEFGQLRTTAQPEQPCHVC